MTHYLSEALWLEYLKQAAGTSLLGDLRFSGPAFASILEHYEWTIRTKTMSEEDKAWVEAHDDYEIGTSPSGETSESGS